MDFTLHPWAPGTLISDVEDAEDDFLEVDTDVEVLAEEWRALQPTTADVRDIVFIDGARRHDANAFLGREPCLLVVMAAGAVLAGPGRQAEVLKVTGPLRYGVLASELGVPERLSAGELAYEFRSIAAGPLFAQLNAAAQFLMREAEVELAREMSVAHGDANVVIDGPRAKNLPANALGFLKTVARERLPIGLVGVVHTLPAGCRTPLYRVVRDGGGSVWEWAFRPRPPRAGSYWAAGTVRVQASGEMALIEAAALADWSALELGRYSSDYHQDGRAPQQLLVVKGLETRLRSLFGHPSLVELALRGAARGAT